MQKKRKRITWTSEKDRFIWDLYDKGIAQAQIAQALKKRFNDAESSNTIVISSRLQKLRHSESFLQSIEATDKSSTAISTGTTHSRLEGQLQTYDQRTLLPAIEQRERIIYDTLKAQAEQVAAFDAHSGLYQVLQSGDPQEILKAMQQLGREKRLEAVLEHEGLQVEPPKLDIAIAAPYKRGTSCSLILPVHLAETRGASKDSLAMRLNNAALYVMVREIGCKEPKDVAVAGRFLDLARYQFQLPASKKINEEEIGSRIEQLCNEEYSGINVTVVEVGPFFEDFTK